MHCRHALTLRLSLAAMACVLGLAGPAPAQGTASVLRVVPQADLRVLDPIAGSSNLTRIHALQVYETLFAWDEQYRPQPMMISQHEVSADGLTYTFTLRSGLSFHDGQTVTSKDVVASLNRWMKRDGIGRFLATLMASLEPLDDLRFVLRLKEPYDNVVLSLGSAVGQIPAIMRAKDAQSDPMTPVTEIVGSGPFRFNQAEWAPGSRVVYDRNKDYKPRTEATSGLAGARLVKIDRMEWVVMPDPATAAAALGRGEVDFMESPPPDVLPILSRSKEVTLGAVSNLDSQSWLIPNHLYPPFDNPKMRQALAAMVNQEDFMMAAIGDPARFKICYAYFTCGSPYETAAGSEMLRGPDPDRARKLLAEAGYKGEKIIVLGISDIATTRALAEVAVQQMKSIGLNVEVAMPDYGTALARWNKKDPPAAGGWNVFVASAAGAVVFHPLTNFYVDTSCQKTNFSGWPCDEEAVTLRKALILARGDDERKSALEALHRRLWEIQPYVLTGQYSQTHAWRQNVHGLLKSIMLAYWNISKS